MSITLSTQRTGRSLVSEDLFHRLTNRIVTAEGFERDFAERIVDQALAFLATCSSNTGAPLAPSELVDIGWHSFILDTYAYAAFCYRVAGRFLHHVPTDGNNAGEAAAAVLARTTAAMRALGFRLDDALWPRTALGS